ncbi:MAG: MFS transporter [Chloroflexota bacterium]|nr:MAG: MFS transporter [Chloroflexota bacterium]
MDRSLVACLLGTFTLRFSTGLTGALLVYYLAELPRHGGEAVSPVVVGLFGAAFFVAELVLSPLFGLLSDRLGHHRVMQVGPVFGAVAVLLTYVFVDLRVLSATRFLEGASTAASVPSILGFIAMVTAGDELLRGRASARFEAATLAGLGLGLVFAGFLYRLIGPVGFLLNALIYGGSYLIFRFGVADPAEEAATRTAPHYGWRRYLSILSTSHVWLLAPTWIAVNAALGLWTSQSIFQLVRRPAPRFADQALMGSFGPIEISLGIGVGLLVFLVGLAYWGERFRNTRRTTIIFYGIVGGAALVAAAAFLNHSRGFPIVALAPAIGVVGGGLFVLAGATPAALGLLADLSEGFPADRGAIMGLYSVFLALGQIGGNLVGGVAAEWRGIDGLLVATLAMLVVALLPLSHLRVFEHHLDPGAAAARAASASPAMDDRPPA